MNAVATLASLPPSFGPSPTRPSRRIATRRQVLLPCQVVRLSDFKLIADRTIDVSIEGMLVPLQSDDVLTGEQLIVSFPIPGLWIDAEATVMRIVHGRRPCDDGLALGLEFDVISPTSRAALAGFLHGRPPPLPRRGPLSRLHRGEPAPQLADHTIVDVCLSPELPSTDVVDCGSDDEDDDFVDGLGILREVAAAWKKLVIA
ncbi:MAG: PilZ domain-containing protein [Deltaproteobacteria bacterium]|nr:PilZ domain-containing protein [Deltaproteobacteria bacterium]